MKRKRPLRYVHQRIARLRDTRRGIALFGAGATFAFTLLSAAMHSYRPFFEPLLRVLLPYAAGRLGGGHYHYDPSNYVFWAWMPLVFAAVLLTTCLVIFITKPATDRRIDSTLRQRLQQQARGAPLEP